eukprot:4890-Heterococcus_DN1.PRE.2
MGSDGRLERLPSLEFLSSSSLHARIQGIAGCSSIRTAQQLSALAVRQCLCCCRGVDGRVQQWCGCEGRGSTVGQFRGVTAAAYTHQQAAQQQ